MNEIRIITPYKSMGTWVFDDPAVDLVREPFVAGIPELIERLVGDIPDAESGFRLLFTDGRLPDEDLGIEHVREEGGGHWYRARGWDLEGWLCPAMFRYFERPPERISIRAEAIGAPEPNGEARATRTVAITSEELALFVDAFERGDTPAMRSMIEELKTRLV